MYIYELVFPTGHFYIGKTTGTLEGRLKSHCSRLVNKTHYNYKMQSLFKKHKQIPEISALEECTKENIDAREIHWIKKLHATTEGLNITSGGEGPSCGEDNPFAKYSLDDYKAVVIFLALTDMTLREIAVELDITLKVVEHISCGEAHQYLKDIIPIEYAKMMQKKGNRKPPARNYVYPDLLDPSGKIHTVTNISRFADQYALDPSTLSKLFKGKARSHKGWRIAQ